ncbi:NAD(P)-binding protein [Methylobacterium brachiatum]|uniref:NAD(P)-binding protein n=1 Tax=Methylobacterium brachiatum TaxID=269660 RepID=UPI0022870E5C|nr:NAD(P)-binding protein [Methylobacterium brachiatum]
MTSEFDVIVVGGGAAGIGAVRRLVDSGASCLLLEASQRLGCVSACNFDPVRRGIGVQF